MGALIQAVSRVTLREFQDKFNEIVAGAASFDVDFFTDRGTALHSLELTSFECVDKKTAEVLQEIIQETTNRENRLQKQLSENEVEHERMAAQIEIEKERAAYVEAKAANEKLQASVEGEAEGTRLAQSAKVFLALLDESIPKDSGASARLDLLRFFSEP